MKYKLPGLVLVCFFGICAAAPAKPSSLDLVGRWNGVIEFGKFKFKMNLKVAPSEDGKQVKVTMSNPDRGMKDMPVAALLYNHPEVRIEIDQFGTAFNGKLNTEGTAIIGEIEEGMGGKPVALTFNKNTEPEKPEPTKSYSFASGETPDIRGYWSATLKPDTNTTLRLGLKIGRLPDGIFEVLMDSFDQGAHDIPATSVTITNGTAKIEWEMFRAVFEPKLSADGKQLVGTWKQGAKTTPVTFDRLTKPATALPEGVSFTPDKNSAADIRGDWRGTLDADGTKLRIAIKLGKLLDGAYAATLVSLDQGGDELLASAVGFTNPVVRIDCKQIGGSFVGNLNKASTEIAGNWEQRGTPLPLNLKRAELIQAEAKP
ncbi:MAG: hypothetical protein HY043_02385 [Verrucomicrobia bacterium]|nr:hypothetical protein [Verrucomicrobiota bacterium]